MSFGTPFGGFGQQNTSNQPAGYGGFGANTNNTSSGFGTGNAGGGLFGGTSNNNNTIGGGGFGAAGFGANAGTGAFGSKPAFGSAAPSTTGTGLFGGTSTANNTGSSAFGGAFGGGTATNNTTSSPFGSGAATSGGMFGSANKPTGFGAPASNTSSSLFGGGASNTTTSGFGGAFGSTATNTLGGGVGDPPGTGITPFQAHTEKEPNSTSSNSFQNLLFQDPYKKWSAEELRLADYVQGRKHGNAPGGGAFGVASGFGGGFGSTTNTGTAGGFGTTGTTGTTGGGLFGAGTNNNTTTSGFGSTGTSAFGSTNANTAGGSLFGANKPATGGGLFGGGNNAQPQQQQQSGGLFGGGGNTGGAFGSTNTGGAFGSAATNTGGGLFGAANNQQNKPAGTGFSFGNTASNATNTTSTFGGAATGGFGAANTNPAGGGLFGAANTQPQQATGGGLFGGGANTAQTNTTSAFGGGFGQQNQQQQAGGGLFGAANQQKPATGGLFGGGGGGATNPAGGGLFGGGNNAQQQTTSAFGAANANTAGGGLFGAAKPATGGGLFGGGAAPTQNTGGGLFGGGGLGGNTQTQQPATGGLFGNNPNQQQKPSLFGASTTGASSGLFGGQNNQQAPGSNLFGASMNQQQQQQQNPGLGGSMLGSSQLGGNAPQGLTANLSDVSAYGAPLLFSGLGGNEFQNPGPLATPLNSNSKPRKSSILPMYKLAPASASRMATPQKRGFGFSYSSYGTPGSPAGSASSTPGALSRSLLGSNSSGGLSKSSSANSLRRSFNTEDSILAPGAFSSNSTPRWYGSSGSKKLVINRDIRSDLFSTPPKGKQAVDDNTGSRKIPKRVSFNTESVDAENRTPVRGALPVPEDEDTTEVEETTPRQNKSPSNGASPSIGSKTPEMEQVKGNELALVRGEDTASPEASTPNGADSAPGQYWMQPPKEDLLNINRMQRQRIDGFTVGRDNVGYIAFKVPVDISNIDLEEICGGIIQLEPRSATVYPVSAKKPPQGKGLNVPARISLEQSWPRGGRDKRVVSDPKRFNKHVERLKRIENTTFESYDKDTGIWTFSVEHFTTYGLDDDDESDEEMDITETTPLPASQQLALEVSDDSPMEEDTFEFRKHRVLPGAFDERSAAQADAMTDFTGKPSFLGVSSADSAPNDVRLSLEEEYPADMGDEYDVSDDEDMARSSLGPHLAAEHDIASSEDGQDVKKGTPGGILRARMRAMKDSVGPVKLEVADGDDWTEMLRKSVSPVKRDRQLLREMNDSPAQQSGLPPDFDKSQGFSPRKSSIWNKSPSKNERREELAASSQFAMDKGIGFATSIDLMNSLFEKPRPAPQNFGASTSSKGFPQFPYERPDKNYAMEETEKMIYDAGRPSWGPDETLVVPRPLQSDQYRRSLRNSADILTLQRCNIQTDRQEVRLANFATEPSKMFLRNQDQLTDIRVVDGVPTASLHVASLKDIFHHQGMKHPANIQEKRVWELASILFDDVDGQDSLARKGKLSQFWVELVDQASTTAVHLAATSEEKAVACLAGHRITEACKHLLDGKNFRLGTLVPLIGSSDAAKQDMKEQLKAWHDSKMLSEFSEAIRTIYELLSGNVCVCEGMKGVPVEDRMDSFVISKKFGLDWRQAFGLRLWYAISQGDDLAAAVHKFAEDINQDKEYLPRPWYIDQGIQPLWDDGNVNIRQDLLWGLLQLYADDTADLEALLRPENSQLSPLDMRVCWQLGLALVATGKVTFGNDSTEKADAATIAYAAQLTGAGEWLEAIFVLLHLSSPVARTKAIQEHLCRHAGLIGSESSGNFAILTDKFHIPSEWIWEALALYMRSVKNDPYGEVQCLLRAGGYAEAHRILVQQVAPLAVIERDYSGLSALISQFEGRQESIGEWASGGEIYGYFLALLQHRSKAEAPSLAVIDRLLAGLQAMNESAPKAEIVQYAAISDMADETAKEILNITQMKQDKELRSRILSLPLTQDRLLAYSLDLSMDRYREVMSH